MCHAVHPHRADMHNEPHIYAPDPHVSMAAKVGSDTICNALKTPKDQMAQIHFAR
jgi:hypothetical protein